MICVPACLGVSDIQGFGLFAGEDIPAGTVVWQHTEGWYRTFPVEDIPELPQHLKDMLFKYAFIDKNHPEQGFFLCLCDGRFMNHSPDPNLTGAGEANIARRDIKKGEELTCDYGSFCKPNPYQPWLEELLGIK